MTELAIKGLKWTLLGWFRKSELSADRAAYIVTQNKEKIISLLMKIAGGSTKLFNMIDYDDFISQYDEWDQLMGNFSNKLIEKWYTLELSHPFPIIRAHEINKWIDSGCQDTSVPENSVTNATDPTRTNSFSPNADKQENNSPLSKNRTVTPPSGNELILAVLKEDYDGIKSLIAQGVDVNFQDESGDTALISAIYTKNFAIIELLVEYNALADIKNEHGESAVTLAKNNGLSDVLKIIQ